MTPEAPGSVSVVITAYECASYLGQAIDSVLTQSRPAQQVIIVDDGSTDGCADVVRGFGNRVTYFYQSNEGIGPARNAGLRLATGHWLALLDGDDYWTTEKLAVQLAAVAAEPGLEAVFAYMQVFNSPDLTPEAQAQMRAAAVPLPGYYASTLLIQREAFWRVGPFSNEYQVGEFVEWYGRAQDAGLRAWVAPETLVWRRQHANNTTRRQRDRRQDYARLLKATLDRRRATPAADDV